MHDPALLLFAAGALAGIAASLLAGVIPHLAVILRYMVARRRIRGRSQKRFSLG
jgi:hypothetical protein